MDIVQSFYDNLAGAYHKLFQDWHAATREQGSFLDGLIRNAGLDTSAQVLDCACGIGTQAIGLSELGYPVTASDISSQELALAAQSAKARGVNIAFSRADFRRLEMCFSRKFDVIIAMDNALPHMLSKEDLACAVESILGRLEDGGVFIASIRDYDALLKEKPTYSPPYIHQTQKGRRVSFQTWHWEQDQYDLVQYIIDDEDSLQVSKFPCRYRAVTRQELTQLLKDYGCREVTWQMPAQSGFYQPIVIAKK